MQQSNSEKHVWVIVSSLKENSTQSDLERITNKVSSLVDEWAEQGKFVWSGPLDNNQTAMAVFEATEEEATKMHEQNKIASSGVLDSYLYKWDALPILSVLN